MCSKLRLYFVSVSQNISVSISVLVNEIVLISVSVSISVNEYITGYMPMKWRLVMPGHLRSMLLP